MDYKFTLTSRNIFLFLDYYAKKVDYETCKKIDYEIWEKINNLSKTSGTYIFYFSLEGLTVYTKHKDDQKEVFCYKDYPKAMLEVMLNNFPAEIIMTYDDIPSLSGELSAESAISSAYSNSVSSVANTLWNSATDIATVADSISIVGTTTTEVSNRISEVMEQTEYLMATVKKLEEEKKEEENMKDMFNFDFGPVSGDAVRLSMYGIAVKNASGNYVSYDAKSDEIMDVDILNFNCSNMLYKMPVAIKDIAPGDVIIHAKRPMYVIETPKDGKDLFVVDVIAGERKFIMPTRNMFGFNFYVKVVNFLDMVMDKPDSDNPFGSMWMLLAMNEEQDMSAVLPMMLMTQGNSDIDPMMMMLMMNNGNSGNMSTMLPTLYMMGIMKNKYKYNCQCDNH